MNPDFLYRPVRGKKITARDLEQIRQFRERLACPACQAKRLCPLHRKTDAYSEVKPK